MSASFPDAVPGVVQYISKSFDGSQFKDMLSACVMKDYLTPREEEETKDFVQLFKVLQGKDFIRPGDVKVLEELLQSVNRVDLKKTLIHAVHTPDIGQSNQTSRRPPQPHGQAPPSGQSALAPGIVMAPQEDTLGEDLMPYFDWLVEHIGRDWRFLGRQLKLKQFDFDCIVEEHPRNLREQIMSMLSLWKERNRKNATKAALVKALRNCRMNLAADNLEKMNLTEG